jgi:mevalonate kinase
MTKNQPNFKKYPSKVILFGEYTVLIGGHVFAVPYGQYYASWQYGKHFPHLTFIDHVKQVINGYPELHFETEKWNAFYKNHGYLESSIPNGYGLGSSGTVVAALFDSFVEAPATFKADVKGLKNIFAEMEAYFHGSSSGIDPLLSYIQKPLLYHKDVIETMDYKEKNLHFDLIDCGSKRYMDKLVLTFNEKLADQNFKSAMELLKTTNNTAITALLENNTETLYQSIVAISEIHFTYLSYLITDNLKREWEAALNSNGPKYKLCGAGGGGFYLKVNVLPELNC